MYTTIRRNLFHFVATVFGAVTLATRSWAAISVGSSGVGPLPFDAAPTGTDFLRGYFGGGSGSFTTTAGVDAAVRSVPASAFTPAFTLATSATMPPSVYSYGFRYNTTGHFLQSRAATTSSGATNTSAAVLLLATLQNDSGAVQSGIDVSYDFGVNNILAAELPGHRVYWSLTGAGADWQFIPELSGTEVAGRLSAHLNLGSWPAGGLLYLLWFDDNGSGDPDTSYTIDNFSVTLPASIPVELVSSPTNTVANEGQTVVMHVDVLGSGLQYQWYHDGASMQDLSVCNLGHQHVITGASGSSGANLTIKSVEPGDAGEYFCVIMNFSGEVISIPATLTVNPDTTPPRLRFAFPGAASTNIVLYFSEPLNDSCAPTGNGGVVTDLSTWSVDELIPGQPDRPLGVHSFTNSPDITGATVIGINTFIAPLNPSHVLRITLNADLPDTSAAQNVLPFESVFYVGASTNELVSLSHAWRYNDQDANPGPNWFSSEPAGFLTGPGPFDAKRDGGAGGGPDGLGDCRAATLYGLGTVGTCLRLQSPISQTNLITANFWTHFNFSGDPAVTILRVLGKVDDGAVIYLNGQELQRIRMASAPAAISRSTFASGTVNDTDAQDAFEFIAPALLHSGDNLVAVELHQSTSISSDLTMGLRLVAVTPPSPRLSITHDFGFVTLNWQPNGGQLQYRDSLSSGQWTTISGATSGYSEESNHPRRFFRVVLP